MLMTFNLNDRLERVVISDTFCRAAHHSSIDGVCAYYL